MKIIYKIVLAASFLLLSVHASFAKKGRAKVSCNNVDKYQSAAGIINIPEFKLGRVLMVDTIRKSGGYFMSITVPSNRMDSSTRYDTVVVLTSTGFDIDFSGQVSKAKANVQAAIKSNISNNTTFRLTNSISKSIHDPTYELNLDQSAFNRIKEALINNPNNICIIVSSILYADGFEFQLKKSDAGSGSANILNFGNFKVSVDYECQGSLKINAKQGGVFYRYTVFKLDDTKTKLVYNSFNMDLTQYKIYQTLME